MRFIMSNNPGNLAAALDGLASATVEAEYGDVCVPGSVITMAHHGPRKGQMAPCAYPNWGGEPIEVVGLSHLDLDSLGGCAALLGRKADEEGFWALAEFVDLNGAHMLAASAASAADLERLYAWWAWNANSKVFPPRDGSVADVTAEVHRALDALDRILVGDASMLADGEIFRKKEAELNAASFVEAVGGVITRVSGSFVNHLYAAPSGAAAAAVVAFNTLHGSVTVSFADGGRCGNAREIVQALWGPLAGGHDGIAGSPRGDRMTLADLHAAASAVRAALA